MTQIAPGGFYALDASNGPGPGFEFNLPAGKKARLWPDPAEFTRHRGRNTSMIHQQQRRRRARLGDITDTSSTTLDFPAAPVDTTDPGSIMTGPNVNLNDPALQIDSSTTTPASSTPAASTSPWTKIATTIINDASAIANPLIRQATAAAPYYITGANGAQVLYDPTTGKVVNAGIGTAIANLSPNTLLYAALAIAALFALSESGKK